MENQNYEEDRSKHINSILKASINSKMNTIIKNEKSMPVLRLEN